VLAYLVAWVINAEFGLDELAIEAASHAYLMDTMSRGGRECRPEVAIVACAGVRTEQCEDGRDPGRARHPAVNDAGQGPGAASS
jgi:hypothetical protein